MTSRTRQLSPFIERIGADDNPDSKRGLPQLTGQVTARRLQLCFVYMVKILLVPPPSSFLPSLYRKPESRSRSDAAERVTFLHSSLLSQTDGQYSDAP